MTLTQVSGNSYAQIHELSSVSVGVTACFYAEMTTELNRSFVSYQALQLVPTKSVVKST